MAITDEKEDEKAGQNLDEVDNMQADFSDYHAISNMKSSIPVSFSEHVQTGVEYVQNIGLLPTIDNA